MKALILVDLQNDFCPGGALPVPEGDAVIPVANALQSRFDVVVATQDWHPANHASFAASHPGHKPGESIDVDGLTQVLWPVHCVQGTWGAEFHPRLDRTRIARVFRKGTDPRIDSYSGFFDNGRRHATGLADYLRERKVNEVFVCGLATDYCVKFTALDAIELGFATHVILDACRGVDLRPGDVQRAVSEMQARGIAMVDSSAILAGS